VEAHPPLGGLGLEVRSDIVNLKRHESSVRLCVSMSYR
jgi:hypothetical protein